MSSIGRVSQCLSLNEQANLRSILEGWRGKAFSEEELAGFDIAALLGKPCLVDIEHKAKRNGNMKSKVKSVNASPAGRLRLPSTLWCCSTSPPLTASSTTG
jgi:hypothetical protein